MGQRPKPPTPEQVAAARKQYEEDVAAGRRLPLPNLGRTRAPGEDWTDVAGPGYEAVEHPWMPEERKALGINFNPFDYVQRVRRDP